MPSIPKSVYSTGNGNRDSVRSQIGGVAAEAGVAVIGLEY